MKRASSGTGMVASTMIVPLHLFFSSLIIFFVAYCSLSDTAWDAGVTTFVQEMLSVWFMGARS
jgi:hypothetical protein